MIFLKTRRALAKFLLAMICSKARANSASRKSGWVKPEKGALNGFPWRFGSLAMFESVRTSEMVPTEDILMQW